MDFQHREEEGGDVSALGAEDREGELGEEKSEEVGDSCKGVNRMRGGRIERDHQCTEVGGDELRHGGRGGDTLGLDDVSEGCKDDVGVMDVGLLAAIADADLEEGVILCGEHEGSGGGRRVSHREMRRTSLTTHQQ